MRYLAFIILILFTTGCSVTTLSKDPKYEWLTGGDSAYGDRPGDVCISCGENWVFIQNEPLGAQREAKRNGFEWGKGCMYRF